MEWAVCAASSDSEDATARESNEEDGSPSNRKQQDSLYGAGEQLFTKDAHKSVDLTFDKEAASTRNGRNSMDSVNAKAGKKAPDKESQDLTHFEKQQGFKLSAPNIMGSTCTVNISDEDGIPDHDPKDFTVEKIPEGDSEELDLVTQEDLRELAEALEFDSPTSTNGVSEKLNPGTSTVRRKKRNLTEDGLDKASKLVKRLEIPQESQMPCASTECGESASGPSCSQWNESFQSEHLEENWAAEEPVSCTESKAGEGKGRCTKCNITHRKLYRCPECNKPFATKESMCFHLLGVHNVEKPFQCRECNLTFNSLLLLNQHSHRIHNTKKHKCLECNKKFGTLDGMSKHRLAIHNVEKSFLCKESNLTFNSISLLMGHHCMTHKECFKCPKCKKYFPDESSMLKHCMMVHFQCIDCNSPFISALDLHKHHSMAHGTGESFKCPDCNAQFFNAEIMKQHRLIIHNINEYFSCPHCMKEFISFPCLMQHLDTCSWGRLVECTECNIILTDELQLRQHQWKVHNIKPTDDTNAFSVDVTFDWE